MVVRLLALFAALALSPGAAADLAADPSGDSPAPDGLTGRDIYDRVVARRLFSFEMTASLDAEDGSSMVFWVRWKDYEGRGGVNSRTVVQLRKPFDLRFGGFYLQDNEHRGNDEFAYLSVFRRVFRTSLRGVGLYGTDFTVDDVVPREAQDFLYHREPDEVYEGLPVFVVELRPQDGVACEHSRIRVFVDQARDVILRATYWNAAGEQTKELSIPRSSLHLFEESWIPMEATMRGLLTGDRVTLRVLDFVANPELGPGAFDLGRLESH